ncbi:MAG: dihydrolipoyl dehydrogenase [Methylotenera sp. 24-45-7]|nr:MAG: dihydrolipoyl dehydrogenase [Mehylophilales bacterium 35-46-6]OYZ40768.1 MAG: dihydrolipoyl dehydrogenase [Methylotenera sp. 24-45-7]OZA08561.1 MAG: dihydrolipoyl dehydrogenase [Methylotenera sp. 17-45-7]OZA53992.1 MAG: dihydrolipoyl dehydrogenase [Methylophilales bacterium 39-45-7]HQS37345.1 dihydrolipoyl dehydrogenase [Methylotenera sp.]
MSNLVEVLVPDIGNFDSVDVIEVLVKPGDIIAKEDSLITVESDKASMDIPSSQAGTVKEVKVKVGDKIAKGSLILMVEINGLEAGDPGLGEKPVDAATANHLAAANAEVSPSSPPSPQPLASSPSDMQTQVVVLGSGPGGYTAAFRAADLGLQVVLIERYSTLGGVCLNVGCIPSKALLHTAKVITEAEETSHHGVSFSAPNIDLEQLRNWKANDVVGKLTGGLAAMAKQRGVTVVNGIGKFTNSNQIAVTAADGKVTTIGFENAIIAAGSQATKFPGVAEDPRIMDSTGALALADIPKRMLVIGGGIIGLEMGTVYDALGAKVTVVEFTDGLIQGCDRDLVRPLQKRMEKRFEAIMLNTKVASMEAKKDGIHVTFEGVNGNTDAPKDVQVYDRVLVSIGRRPNGKNIGAENAGVAVDDYGFIKVDKQMRTNVQHIFAIGDIVGQPMLAHKATHEGKVAAEVIAGHKVEFQALVIPSVAYTDPEVAWAGMTETEAKAKGIEIEKASFPWAASGRALSVARTEGATKLIFDKETHRVIGAGIVGVNAGELLAEAVLAIEMGADAHDLGLTIHAHPTLSETVCFAAEMKEGTITDLYIKKR